MSWQTARITRRTDWAPGLLSLSLDVVPENFTPGQFVNLALPGDESSEKRAYSLASAAGQPAEFLISEVPGGSFTPKLFQLNEGDTLKMDTAASGFFTLQWLPEAAKELWLISTGTGLGPFMAMLRSPELLYPRFDTVVLVHGVREVQHLAYAQELQSYDKLRYLPLVSRQEPPEGGLRGRSPELISSGALEARAGLQLDPERSHVMLCGNPDMIQDATEALSQKGLRKHRQRKPGHITTEKYW